MASTTLMTAEELAEMEPDRSLIRFSTCITFHPDLHTLIVTSIPRPEAESKKHRCHKGERPFIPRQTHRLNTVRGIRDRNPHRRCVNHLFNNLTVQRSHKCCS